MTRIIFALVLALALVRPAAAQDTPAALLKGYLAAWNSGNAEAAAAFMADDAVFFDAVTGEPLEGREAVLGLIQGFMTAITAIDWSVRGTPLYTADGIAFEWTFSGVNTGAFGPDMPATNKPVSFIGLTIIHLKDGKIVYEGDYYDSASLMAQITGQ